MADVEASWRHDPGPTMLAGTEDVDALIDEVLAADWQHSVIALYDLERPMLPSGIPDHELRVAVAADSGLGGIRYAGGSSDGTWYVPGTTDDKTERLYYYAGADEPWPLDSLVPLELVRAAVKDFMINGGDRPTGVEWKPWP